MRGELLTLCNFPVVPASMVVMRMVMNRKRLAGFVALVLVSSTLAQPAWAQRFNRVRPGAAEGVVNLPYTISDTQGNMWMIYNNGWFQQQGGNPTFTQSAMLTVNGNQPTQNNNVANLDSKTGEVVLENMQAPGNVAVTRRIKIDKDAGVARYIDVFRNNGTEPVNMTAMIQSNLNFGVTTARNIGDPKRRGQEFAWTAQTGNNRGAGFMFAGKGAKVVPVLNYVQGNNVVSATMDLKLPAGKEAAVVTFYYATGSMELAGKWALDCKESKLLADVPKEVRRVIVNFPINSDAALGLDVLRGDVFDVIELRGGDQLRGTLKDPSWKLDTSFGPVELPADSVVALLNVGTVRPRQLVVTSGAEIFGGQLASQAVSIDLSNGQTVSVPLAQVTRIGYRKRAGEPDEIAFDKPFVTLRSGDRVVVHPLTTPVDFVTRFGTIKIDPKTLASLSLSAENQPTHQVRLTDGSTFTGIAPVDAFAMTLAGAGQAREVSFSAASVARVQLDKGRDDLDDEVDARLTLDNGDVLVGSLTGTVKLATAFDTLTLSAGEIKRLTPVVADSEEGTPRSTDVQVTLWDQTSVGGQLLDTSVDFRFKSGQTARLPLALIQDYVQPLPEPSATVKEKILAIVKELNADDWRARDRAEEQLVTLGTVVIGVLTDARPDQPPEAQQRIDSALKKIKQANAPKPAGGMPVPVMMKD